MLASSNCSLARLSLHVRFIEFGFADGTHVEISEKKKGLEREYFVLSVPALRYFLNAVVHFSMLIR